MPRSPFRRTSPVNTDQGLILLTLARNAIAQALDQRIRPHAQPPWLDEPGAAFVTLSQRGELRGCIGSLEARRALRADVEDNAQAAAFRDPRFAPLGLREYADTDIEVSVLSALTEIEFAGQQQALAELRPGVDGVVLEYGARRGTFLPQVWEQLPEPHEFLAHLKQKAGLPAAFWDEEIKLWRYTVTKWREQDYDAAFARSRA
ncbi:MAG: AMMECR1 domain-containing protein [Candidatus Muproteobacteria bacterium RBG_16_64_11]|uniref:AMMECR1 domain-containing protein n=1 Tax=Candidatus Muproteobacteria bacterium RBG_16_64_11 TaxID=1817758 RepID=A0A1F6TH20_9PROT|nr:MAG: AMMECR1 domain-containing protein [Candidatus Muproteobacteria bacterium RBG_16_64_11]